MKKKVYKYITITDKKTKLRFNYFIHHIAFFIWGLNYLWKSANGNLCVFDIEQKFEYLFYYSENCDGLNNALHK